MHTHISTCVKHNVVLKIDSDFLTPYDRTGLTIQYQMNDENVVRYS